MRNYIQRDIQPYLHRMLEGFPTVSLCGPRQSGKTTLCRMEFPQLEYVNLENPGVRQLALQDPMGFISQFNSGAILDEIQLVPALFSSLQVVIDEDRFIGNNNRKFILTGSSNFALQPGLRQSLAGRTALLTLLPFSLHELKSGGYSESADEYIFYGGYPAVWDSGFDLKTDIMENYINTYVERDIRRLMEVKDINKFHNFIKLCAARIGTELNKSSLSVELGVSVSTIDNWISVLEASYVMFLLKPWFSNIGKRLTKTPKVYFYDTGLACTLLNITSAKDFYLNPMRGQLFENMIISDQQKKIYNFGLKEELFFFRDKTGNEVDLLINGKEGIKAFEIKAGATFQPEYLKNLKYLKKILGEKIYESGVIYNGETELPKKEEAIINFTNFK